jgi:hypothetical protein
MKILKRFSLLLLLIISFFAANAQVDSTMAVTPSDSITQTENQNVDQSGSFWQNIPKMLSWGGYIQTDDRMKFKNSSLYWQEYRLDLKAEFNPSDRAKFYADIWVRTFKFPRIVNTGDLSSVDNIVPINLQLREAYFDVYGLFTKNIDMRVGRQRIAWGTADKFNPTDNLNPYDLEDVWDFGRHLGSNSIKLTYYAGSWTFTGVGIPWFTPSVFPGSDWAAAFTPDFQLPEKVYTKFMGIDVPIYLKQGEIVDSVIMPQADIKHYPSFGFKVKKSIKNWDVSASYVYTRDVLPVITRTNTFIQVDTIIFNPGDLHAEATANINAYLEYPHFNIVGLDFAGSIGEVGVWGEGALFLPEETYMQRHVRNSMIPGDSIMPDSLVISKDPYVKFILGLDYHFKHGIYLNFQYLHGFVNERSDDLNDYYLLAVEWKLLNEKLKLSPINAGFQIGNYGYIRDNHAFIYMPEVSYSPIDNAEITVGARIIDGTSTTSFGRVMDNDQVYIKLKYSF